MQLWRLIEGENCATRGPKDVEVEGITADAGQVRPGWLYVHLTPTFPGASNCLATALRLGGCAVLADHDLPVGDCTLVMSRELPQVLGRLMARWCGSPSHEMQVLAVTGTNGKTTVTHFVRDLLSALGRTVGIIGTLGAHSSTWSEATGYTTPPSLLLQPLLARMLQDGVRAVALEASSQALDEARLAGVDIAVAAITNVTRDHLDYHGTLRAYAHAKARLFETADSAVFNIDDRFARRLSRRYAGRALTVSVAGTAADLVVHAHSTTLDGTAIRVTGLGVDTALRTSWVGDYNLANLAVSLGMVVLSGASLRDACEVIPSLRLPAGRLQRVLRTPAAFVDYAHTPDAIRSVLLSIRSAHRGRIIVVFGAGGDRDPGKRPLMGGAVSRLADVAFITSDNPRTESAERIISDIVAGWCGQCRVEREADRRHAILAAVRAASADDVVLVLGKGHEVFQELDGRRVHFSDVDELMGAHAAEVGGL